MKEFIKNKKNLLIVVGICLLIAICIGITYAYYLATVSQQGENVVKTDCFKITYTDQDEISLDNSFPITDADGATLTPYQFTVKNVCETSQYYEANLETLSTSTIDESLMKVKIDNKTPYKYGTNGYADNKVIASSKNAIKIASGSLAKNEERTYALRLWLDEGVTLDTPNVQNKSYIGKVTIYAAQNNRNFSIAIQRNNTTIKEDRVLGTKVDGVQYEFSLAETDITDATNISCNEDATADIVDNKLQVSNMHENTICKINDTLKSTIDNLDESRTNIKMIKNENNVQKMDIASNEEVVLDLNGKEIKSETINETDSTIVDSASIFFVNGNLTVNDENDIGGIFTSKKGFVYRALDNSKIKVNGGNYNGGSPLYLTGNNSYAEVNGGKYKSNLRYNFGVNNCENCHLKVNDATIEETAVSSCSIYMYSLSDTSSIEINNGTFDIDEGAWNICSGSNNLGSVIVNGGYFKNTATSVIGFRTGTLTINNGTFIAPNNNIIMTVADQVGTININGGTYSTDSNDSVVIKNFSSTVNITNGTFNSNGFGVYNVGGTMNISNGTFNSYKYNSNQDGTLNISGGTFITDGTGKTDTELQWKTQTILQVKPGLGTVNIYDGYFESKTGFGVRNNSPGVINIKNANIKTYDYNAIENSADDGSGGIINICKANLINNKNVHSNNNGHIYYSTNAFGNVTPNFTGVTSNIQTSNNVCN